MQKKFSVALLLLMMVFILTGCEQTTPIIEILSDAQEYHQEILAKILEEVDGNAPETFAYNSRHTFGEGISCIVDSNSTTSLYLNVMLNEWVAEDGNVISGHIEMDFDYYTSSIYISSIDSMAILNFDLTSIIYNAEVFDEDLETEAFTFYFTSFICPSLSVGGKQLISNLSLIK